MKASVSYTFRQDRDEYLVQLRSKRFPWWILLFLLLPLILLIKIPKELDIQVLDGSSQPISEATVLLFGYDNAGNQVFSLNSESGSNGIASFVLEKKPLYKRFMGSKSDQKYMAYAKKTGYLGDTSETLSYGEFNNENRILVLQKDGEEIAIPDEPQKPKEGCRVFFTGLVVGGEFLDGHISEVYKLDDYSEYVGSGEYPDNEIAFPKSVATTFDGIAIDKGTRVIIYSQKNFQGEIVLDVTGPAIINNVLWKNDDRYSHCNTIDYKPELQKTYPQSVRRWSEVDMQPWSYGSLKVSCN